MKNSLKHSCLVKFIVNSEFRGVDRLLSLAGDREVFRLRGSTGANVYLVREADQGLLIDSGFAEDSPRLLKKIEQVLGSVEHLTMILLTHYHKDHAGGAASLAAATGAKILCSENDADVFRGGQEYVRLPREVSAGTEKFLAATALWEKCFSGGNEWFPQVDTTLNDGDLLCGFRVVAHPGHTPGHLCLYDDISRVLISADYLVYPSEELPQFFKKFIRTVHLDPDTALSSTRQLLQLDFESLLPGHGQPVLRNARSVLKKSDLYRDLLEVTA